MEEVKFLTVRRGDKIHVINKGFGTEVGILHVYGNKYQYGDKEYKHLNNALESLIIHKCSVV